MDAAIASKFVKTLQVAEGQQKRPVHMIVTSKRENQQQINSKRGRSYYMGDKVRNRIQVI